MLHFSGSYAQTRPEGPCPAASPAVAVSRNGGAGARGPGRQLLALLPSVAAARPVRRYRRGAAVGTDRDGRPAGLRIAS